MIADLVVFERRAEAYSITRTAQHVGMVAAAGHVQFYVFLGQPAQKFLRSLDEVVLGRSCAIFQGF